MEEQKYLLEMRGISKSFPGVKALDKVNLRVKSHSVHALMGENGAGKSTLMKCLFGIYIEDEGDIFLEGKKVKFTNPKQALENGVAMVHQELNQVMKRPVMENMMLGRFPEKMGLIDQKQMYDFTKNAFDDIGIDINPKTITEKLSVSQRQMLEIAKAVSYNAKILILDEPTSSLTNQEVKLLFKTINMLKKRGMGIVYISHKMEEILEISDQITVFRDGKYVDTKDSEEMTTEKIINLMVGRDLTDRFPPKTNVIGEPILEIKNLTGKYEEGVKDVSFTLHKGEILGLAGLVGARRTELLETIFGLRSKESGQIIFNGQEVKNDTAKEAIKNGFALLTEERRITGIFPMLDINFNSTIANMKEYSRSLFLDDNKIKKDTKWVIDSMKVKTPTQKTKIRSLSGGNQQKVIIGRWLLTQPEVLLLDEPTRGIDVGAKYEIYQLIIELAKKGKGVIVVSSELPELIGICDRIMVMSNGYIAGVDETKNLDQEQIMNLATKYL